MNRETIIEALSEFGVVHVISIKESFVLLIKGTEMDKFTKVNSVMGILQVNEVMDNYPKTQVMKNEEDYLLITLNK